MRRQASNLRGRVILERGRGLILIYIISFEGMAKYYVSCAQACMYFLIIKAFIAWTFLKNQSDDVIKGKRNAQSSPLLLNVTTFSTLR